MRHVSLSCVDDGPAICRWAQYVNALNNALPDGLGLHDIGDVLARFTAWRYGVPGDLLRALGRVPPCLLAMAGV